jgi:FAD/FMN-containing dehydrogenase
MLTLKEQLTTLLKGDVLDDEESLRIASRDASIFEVRPQIVVAPRDVEDLKTLVVFLARHKDKHLSLTARSGGTDMGGGALTESIVVDFKKYLNKIGKVTSDSAVTQPGAYYRDFEKETLKQGGIMPSYPASREICTVGGMAANNSGGEKSLTYGQTKDYITRLKVILADGNEYVVEPLARNALDHKMQQQDFEGEIYRKMFKLVDENYALVKSARPKVSKNSAGYQAWDIWDKEKGIFDMTKVFAGAQGTLGLITEVTFKLIRPKKYSSLLVIFLKDLARVPQIAQAILAQKPESFESYDDKTLWLALKYLPEFINFLGAKSILSLGLQFLPEVWMALSGGIPKMVLMAEFTADTQKEALTKARRAQAALAPLNLKTRIAPTEQAAKKYWTIRRESFNLLRHHIRDKQTTPFIDDIIVRPEYLPEFMPKLEAILRPYKLTYSIVGHIGQGNFHIIPLTNLSDPRTKRIIPEISRKVYDLVLHYHGSITAEHNDGLIRSPFLKQMFGDKMYDIFEQIKAIFDPDNIFNPGKKVGADFDYAMKHLKDDHVSYHW